MNIIMLSLTITNRSCFKTTSSIKRQIMKNNFTKILCLLFVVFGIDAFSQNVVEVTFLESRTKESISANFGIDAQNSRYTRKS